MIIGLIKEIKDNENRVALTPQGATFLIDAGHQIVVQADAGINSGYSDADYRACGCSIVDGAEAWSSNLILKVKEPLEAEYQYFKPAQMIFTYLHLAGVDPGLTEQLLAKKVTAIAYETVRDAQGALPLLAPMSAVAGGMSINIANHYLARFNGGKGVLLGSVMGKSHGKVIIVGDGVVGQHAARAAVGLGARTYLFARHEDRFSRLRDTVGVDLHCVLSTEENIRDHVKEADAVIGAVLLPGGRTPHIISKQMVAAMQAGSVVVDVSIDQGGCIETSRPTSHSDPVFRVSDVTHYCVTNMPGAYPMTSTLALTNATLPYALALANEGILAVKTNAGFANGVNTYWGFIANGSVAEALGKTEQYRPLETLLAEQSAH